MLLAVLTTACAPRPALSPTGPWRSALGRDHPLAGRLWAVREAQFISPETLIARLAGARFALLGEGHENADHHRLQAWVVAALARAGRRPAIAFEMLTLDQAPLLERHLAASPRDAAGLGEAVGWGRSGWPPWPLYQPIAEAALAAGLPLAAANLSRATTDAVRGGGLTALGPSLVDGLALGEPLPPAVRARMATEIDEAHCGYAPPAMVERMIDVQLARDAHMAHRLARAGGSDGAVLIAGYAHVRRDRGVPVFLARAAPGAEIASLAFLEVHPGRTVPEAYAPDGALPFDYVWFTPRHDDTDPCEKFKASLERLKQRRRE